MPVLISHNIATELRLSNGSIGYFESVVYHNIESNHVPLNELFPPDTIYVQRPLYALVRIPTSNIRTSLHGLDDKIIPIYPEKKSFRVDLRTHLTGRQRRLIGDRTSLTITRTQLPLLPAFAITTYKSQGKTLDYGILDLVPPPYTKFQHPDIYVPLSRFQSLDTTAYLRPIPKSAFFTKPNSLMLREINRLENLARDTLSSI
jgi:hypothetical protein